MPRSKKSYLQPKIMFALSSAGAGSALMYLPIYYTAVLGLRPDQIGVFAALSPFISAVASPLWSSLIDKTQAYRKIIGINYTIATLCALLILLAPAIPSVATPSDPESTNTTASPVVLTNDADSPSFTLTLVTFATMGFATFGAPVLGPLLDGGVLRILGESTDLYGVVKTGNTHSVFYSFTLDVGQQRLWASVGFGSAVLVTGLLLDWTGNMNVIFYIFGATAIGFIFTVSQTDFDVSAKPHRFGREKEPCEDGDEEEEEDERVYVDDEEERLRNRSIFGMIWENVKPFVMHGMVVILRDSLKSLSVTATDVSRGTSLDTRRRSSAAHAQEPKSDVTITLLSDDDLVRIIHHPPSRAAVNPSSVSTEDSVVLLASPSNPSGEKEKDPDFPENAKSTLQELVSDPQMLAFLAIMMFMGISFSVFHNFLMLFLRNDLGASDAMLGWIGPLVLVVEIPSFFYSKEIIARIGIEHMIIIAQGVTIMRALIYTVCPSLPGGAVLALFIQLSHGLAFSALWSAAVVHADAIAPKHLRATSQGLMNAAFNGVGSGLGALLGGTIYQRAGSGAMFLMVAVVTTLGLILFVEMSTKYGMVCWVVKRAGVRVGLRARGTSRGVYEEVRVSEL
ncbi:hypothetical protein BC938DRAFT_483750 [Jimgerdemannia flammicorona]|uniref:Major facilitator superfamily (MFS) profile domain-containing protein n=1 Tax=Jimgerdemannia flammicorona TaxID=994334 RepID=A0A433QBB9_9FUNG|nr:hypothetical protein BC938DRAFT_483750 [Jimgerdemannia flammicorona]